MIDDLADAGRAIGQRRIAAGEARTAIIRRRYDASPDDVWAACTEPGRLARWFLPVSGDLRQGGTFQLAGNAGGEILRCEPPRLLRLTWAYADRPVDEVELRLSPGPDGDTLFELEHASVTDRVDVDGRSLDVLCGDPERGPWGIGVGWEVPLTLGLPAYLRGDLAAVADTHWFAYTPAAGDLAARLAQEWAALVAG